jgi:hypothetical protein
MSMAKKVNQFRPDGVSDLHGGANILDGARATPPEDVGGPDGFHDFLEVITVNPDSEEATGDEATHLSRR